MEVIFSSSRLVATRKLKGMSQEKLAEGAGINIRTLQRLEKNEAVPQPHTLQRLAETLGVAIEELTCQPIAAVDNRQLSLLHFAALVGLFVPSANLVAALAIWLFQKNRSDAFDLHTKAAINFQWSCLAYSLPCLIFIFYPIDILLMWLSIAGLIGSGVCAVLFGVVSGLRVWQGKSFIYPLKIRFLK